MKSGTTFSVFFSVILSIGLFLSGCSDAKQGDETQSPNKLAAKVASKPDKGMECKDLPFISQEKNPYSIMNRYRPRQWSGVTLFPRHIRTLLGPVCKFQK